ncbi:4,5-dihydroxyphthalate decarboxylase [Alicyclobacillus sp.]|uniref:4,5-dihydroxyphthalate decarboxylase n=1 Tax=Alicyclobacillus sp. TaxID=61169 RepID=UPI0025B93704|nr:4,5-dihydroxyphthalate decarboxylase [Alicyclobacillus sp.]MCL6517564.1 4,5-dihydroxyphthalate decarboxylase [Alicyclobacillus sp.]
MTRTLITAMSESDRTLPLLTGRVRLPGFTVAAQSATVEEIFHRQLNDAPYDVAELSLASYLIALGRGESRLTAIPVFLSRSFRHNAIYVRQDSPYHDPRDLAGRRFGFPEFQMTAAVWVRGMFRHQYGIPSDGMTFVTYRPERIPVNTPARRGQAKDLFTGLIEGEVDAVMSARRPPAAVFPPAGEGGPIRRLFPDAFAAEREYYRDTGIFPIMHLVSIRRDVVTDHPELPRLLYESLRRVKEEAVASLLETVRLGATAPWLVESLEAAVRAMGDDVWPYGVAANWAQLETFMQYLMEDGLLERPLRPEDVFHPSVLDT